MFFFIKMLQHWMFKSACRIFVMSEGMQELYRKKYHLESVVIPHCYSEPVLERPITEGSRTLFWAGGIYGINDRAFLSVVRVATRMGVRVLITAGSENVRNRIYGWQNEGLLVEPVFYEKRIDYLEALRKQGALILALNRPEDSSYGREELATIFSTTLPECLASGRPVLLYCPKEYYLAKFFEQHRCGVVVDPLEGDRAIETGINAVLSSDKSIREGCVNALQQAKKFDADCVARKFVSALNEAVLAFER